MPAPKGTRAQAFKLTSGAQVHVYSDERRVVLQLRQAIPTEADVLAPSFKVTMELNAREIMAVAGELLAAASRLTSGLGQGDGVERPTAD